VSSCTLAYGTERLYGVAARVVVSNNSAEIRYRMSQIDAQISGWGESLCSRIWGRSGWSIWAKF